MSDPVDVLIIEDNPADVLLIKDALTVSPVGIEFDIEFASRLAEGLERLTRDKFDIILLNLSLPDSCGLKTLFALQAQEPHLPIVVLSELEDETLGIQALRRGAQDYLIKSQINGALLGRAIRYAIERKQTEQSLREQADRFRAVTEQAPIGIYIIQDDVLVYINPTAAHLFRYDPTEIIEALIPLDLVHPDDREEVRELWQSMEEPGVVCYAFRGVRKDGQTIYCETLARRVKYKGRPAILGTLSDVTKHEQAEEALHHALAQLEGIKRHTPDLITMMDREGRYLMVNQAVAQLLEKEPEQIVGKTFAEVFPPNVVASFMSQLKAVFEMEKPLEVEDEIDWNEGSPVYATTLFPLFDQSGTCYAVGGIARDITERKRAEHELHQRIKELETLRKVGLDLATMLDLDVLLHSIVSHAVTLLEGNAGGLFLYQSDEDLLRWLVGLGVEILSPGTFHRGEGLCGKVWETNEPQVVDDYTCWEGRVSTYENPSWKAAVGVPIQWGDEFLGVLNVVAPQPGAFSAGDVELLALLATQAAAAIVNARLFQETRRTSEELAALSRAGRILTSTLDLEKVLNRTMTEVRTMLDAEGASVLLYNPETDELAFAAIAGVGSEILEGRHIPASTGIAGWAFNQEKPVLVRNAQTDCRFYDRIDATTGITTRSLLAVPLQHRDQIIGVIEAINRIGAPFNEHHLDLLIMLSRSVATAIENARLYEQTAHRLAAMEILREVMLAAASTLDFDQVLTRTLDAIHRALGIEYLGFLLPDETEEHLVAHPYTIGFSALPEGGIPLSVDESVSSQVYLTGEPVLIDDTAQVSNYFSIESWPPLRSELAVPVRVDDRVIGVLNAESPREAAFTKEDLHLFEALGAQLGIVIENARLFEAEREQRRLVEQSQARLVQNEKLAATGRLAASLTHEINNPLQAIRSGLQLMLSSEMTPEEQQAYLEMANEEVERLQKIVARTLDFARRPRWNPVRFDPHTLLKKTLALASKYRQRRHVAIELDLMDDPPTIRGVPDEVEQVFLNLVLNAVEAMPEGGKLRVSSSLEEGRLAISFADTGHGIPPEHLSHIFDPFFSTKETTGLGLSISYDIVERHEGQITVESEVGEGSTFTVWLPVVGVDHRP